MATVLFSLIDSFFCVVPFFTVIDHPAKYTGKERNTLLSSPILVTLPSQGVGEGHDNWWSFMIWKVTRITQLCLLFHATPEWIQTVYPTTIASNFWSQGDIMRFHSNFDSIYLGPLSLVTVINMKISIY